jgi:hypothetical protein
MRDESIPGLAGDTTVVTSSMEFFCKSIVDYNLIIILLN